MGFLLLSMTSAFAQPGATTPQAPNSVLPAVPRQTDIFNPNGIRSTPTTRAPNINLLEAGPARIMTLVLGLFSAISIVIAIYAGAVMIFSDGDQKKVEKGIKTLLYAAIGMMLVGGAWLIVRFVLNIDLTTLW